MPTSLDIFLLESDGRVVWKSTAETMEQATLCVRRWMLSTPAEYLIYSQETGDKIVLRPEKICGRSASASN